MKQKRVLVAITGTPGSGKSHLSKRIANAKIIEINEVVNRYRLFSGKDKDNAKIVKMRQLEKKLKEEIKKIHSNVVLVGHLAADLNLRYDICIVTRCNLAKLRKIMKARGYSEDKIKENVTAEALDYCGINAERKARELYEVETDKEKRDILRYLKNVLSGKRAAKPRIKPKSKMNELLVLIKSGYIK